MTVHSAPQRGSSFELYLPLIQAPPATAKVEPDARPTGRETVLLVDDEEQVLRYTAQLLGQLGYRVITASRGG